MLFPCPGHAGTVPDCAPLCGPGGGSAVLRESRGEGGGGGTWCTGELRLLRPDALRCPGCPIVALGGKANCAERGSGDGGVAGGDPLSEGTAVLTSDIDCLCLFRGVCGTETFPSPHGGVCAGGTSTAGCDSARLAHISV